MSFWAVQDGNDLSKYVRHYNAIGHTFDLTTDINLVKDDWSQSVAQAACNDVDSARFHVVPSPKPH